MRGPVFRCGAAAPRNAYRDSGATEYSAFLRAKVRIAEAWGFEIDPSEVNPLLKPHQRAIVCWMVAGGRRACFAAFGLGKSMMQLEAVRITRARAGGMGLITLPLGVRAEFMADAAKLGITVKFVRRIEECTDPEGIYLTNYETVRDGKLDPRLFSVASLDEAACLRGFGGTKTFREFMALFAGDDRRDHLNARVQGQAVRYRFVATATPSPNDYVELLAYSAFLGIMDVGQAKTRFFKRNSEKADELTIHPHKLTEFWMWVASWGLFVQRPSDLCTCQCRNANNSLASASAASSPSHGSREALGRAHGSVDATAATRSSPPQRTSAMAKSSVAVASAQSTEAREPASSESGRACSTDAVAQRTRTGKTTAAAASPSASAGSSSRTSSPTWANLLTASPSSETTTNAGTSQEIAAGQPGSSRQGTEGRARLRSVCCSECRCDEGYELPPIDVRWHEIAADHADAGETHYGQGLMFKEQALGVVEAAREKRDSLPARIAKLMELRAEDPGAHRVIWHDLEAERRAIERAVPDVVSVFGSQDLDEREQRVAAFSDGRVRELAGKPVMLGSGCNLQRHCAWAVFLGIGFKFNDFIQAIHRLQRFLQTRPVRIDLIYTEAEREVRRQLERKWQQHNEMVAKMTEIIREFGLSQAAMAYTLTRKLGVERVEIRGNGYTLVNSDCVPETQRMADNSVGLVLTSIPFSTQYEYSPNYADFGHTDTNEHFFRQMDFLTPQLLRVLQPGRVAAIHVKDRIVPGGMTGLGFQTVYPFHARCIEHYTRHGFAYLGMKTIVTDVVRENNQTYRLGWTEQCKDATKMGVGMPEYLLLFRKPPSSNEKSYADVPVVKSKARYTRSRWQIDAHGFTRSSGNRLLTPDELQGLSHADIFKLFAAHSLETVYDFEHHVRVGEALEETGRLPVTFMLLQPQSWSDEVWSDITRMLTLNGAQSAKGKEMHLCPMQFDIADRVIEQFSMPGETVFDPFGGLMTVPYRAILAKRRAIGVELSAQYFVDGAAYCKAAEQQMAMPSLFDLEEVAA